MATTISSIVVGVFDERREAQEAIDDLRQSGFREDQLGVAMRDTGNAVQPISHVERGSMAGEGATAGVVAGAGIGGMWAIAIAAGLLPAIGPVIAGGLLASLLASAAAGAAAGGILGALIGVGVPEQEARYYETEFAAGRVLVTVRPEGREDEATVILRNHGAREVRKPAEGRTKVSTG